ncbi:type VI secretion system-associated protein TagO [Paraburkholderia sp. Ac-20340]|nr:type VI secretion system-associated protein TagO [Paraburkholderia sp. Ac-20340]
MLLVSGCHPRQETPAVTPPISACTAIVSPMQRLACFDTVAGTPAGLARPSATAAATASGTSVVTAASSPEAIAQPAIADLVRRNESTRQKESYQFLMSRSPDGGPDQSQIVISAPALGAGDSPQGPWLAISCKSGITRLQLLSPELLLDNRIRVSLAMDGRAISDATTWQVLESGNVVDSGRGLVAIELLRRIGNGARLKIESSNASLDGREFDATGLKNLIDQEREACHW